jgi:N4-gp56 family major capsid protein
MQALFLILLTLALSMSFGEVTTALASGGGYTTIPEAVRDFYSKEVLFQAQPRCKFLQFAKVKRDLQAVKGKSIVFVKYANLTGGGALDEDDTITPVALAASEITIAVKEQANAIELTEYLMRTSLLDVLGDASKGLANNVASVLDLQFRDAVLTTTNVVYGNGASSSSTMNASSVFNAQTVKDAVQTLEMNNAPKFEGEYYVCFASPMAIRQLMDDPEWINANTYNGRRQIYLGEVGMFSSVIFITTTNMPYMSSAAVVTKYGGSFTPTKGCESVIFGENAYAWAIALDVELRDDGIKELGRKHTLGWYGIWGTGLLDENNSVRVLTAAK